MLCTEIIPNGLYADGYHDDGPAIQGAINTASRGSVIGLPTGKRCKILNQLTLTTDVGFKCNGSWLDASGLPLIDSSAVVINATSPGSNYNGNQVPYRFNILGPGQGDGVLGHSSVGLRLQASNMAIDQLNIQNYPIGLMISNNAYGLNIRNFELIGNYCNLFFPSWAGDAGELCAFSQGAIANGQIGLQCDGQAGTDAYFHQTSFDFNQNHIRISSGKVVLESCHIEGIFTIPLWITGSSANNFTSLLVDKCRFLTDVVQTFPVIQMDPTTGAYAAVIFSEFYGFAQDPPNQTPIEAHWIGGAGHTQVRFRSNTDMWTGGGGGPAFNLTDFN